MKIWKFIIPLFALMLLGSQPVEAQFLKKLAKRAQTGAENAVLRKTEQKVEDKAEEKTEEAIDAIFEAAEEDETNDSGNNEGVNHEKSTQEEGVTKKSSGPADFKFEWKYTLRMESADSKSKQQDGDVLMSYYLNADETYVGFRPELSGEKSDAGNMLMIMDEDKGTNYIFMKIGNKKIVKTTPVEEQKENDKEEYKLDYTITKLGTKTIMGYSCQGFKMDMEDGTLIAYIAKNAPVHFKNSFGNDPKSRPKGFDPKWLKEFEDGLMMEMDFKSKKKNKYDFKTTCVGLDKKELSIRLDDYSTSFFGRGKR